MRGEQGVRRVRRRDAEAIWRPWASSPLRTSHTLPARGPSHVEQAVIRLLLAVFAACAILYELGLPPVAALERCECLASVLAYIPGSLLLLAWSLVLRNAAATSPGLHLRLGVALVADVCVVAHFTATSGHYAPLSLPVFLWIIIGYGNRFGGLYALAASGLCMLAFALAAPQNPLFELGSLASVGYYLCFLVTPLYVCQVLGTPVPAAERPWALASVPIGPVAAPLPHTSTGRTTPLVDAAQLQELRGMFADVAGWQQLVRQFEADAHALLQEASLAVARGDDEHIAVALHRLRGAAAQMAAPRLEGQIAGLEADPSQPARWDEARSTLDATVALLTTQT